MVDILLRGIGRRHRHASGALDNATLDGLAGADGLFRQLLDSAGRLYARSILDTATSDWGATAGFAYDGASRLQSYWTTFANPTGFTYNPAGQIVRRTDDNDQYAFPGYATGERGYTANGLNQLSPVVGAGFAYDDNGNLISDGSETYAYDIENRVIGRGAGASLRYDPLGRLYEIAAPGGTRRFLYDGDALVAEYDASGTLLRRYVHGEGALRQAQGDDPLVWFEGSGVTDAERRYLFADERGSIVTVTDGAGSVTSVNAYDAYGVPAPGNVGAFQYTGQVWLPELGMYYYKARMYEPELGRFLQTDPIGYGSGMNLYAYVGGDPVNLVDPTGLVHQETRCESIFAPSGEGDIIVRANCTTITVPDWWDHYLQFREIRGDDVITVVGRRRKPDEDTAPSPQKEEDACTIALGEEGAVVTDQVNGSLIVGGGVTGSWGAFRNLRTGTTGSFFTIGGGGGAQLSLDGSNAVYGRLSQLNGGTVSISGGAGPVGGSVNFAVSRDGVELSGGEFAAGLGIGIGIFTGSVTFTGTKIYDCALGGSN